MAPQMRKTARQMRLAAELREIRESRGKSRREVFEALGWSESKMSRIESAKIGISEEDLVSLLDLYGGVDNAHRAALLELGRQASRRGWYSSYDDVFQTAFPVLEDESTAMWLWDPNIVPGLLQTTAYTRALLAAGSARDPQTAERRVEARKHRQAILVRPQPPVIEVFIGEPVLHWQVGGPGVLREQLLALWDLPTKMPNVSVQVVPFSAGSHYGLEGPLTIFSFEGGAEIGYTETGLGSGTYLESAADLAEINLRRESIQTAALTPQQSAEKIARAADAI